MRNLYAPSIAVNRRFVWAAHAAEGVCLLTLLFALPAWGAPTTDQESDHFNKQKPNIIFILADDLGYGDVGCYGQKHIKTPNLDRMASEGMRFTQSYAGAAVCAPSRCV